MTNFASGFFAAAGLDEFVVAPEGAVDEHEIAGSGRLDPFGVAPGKRWRKEEALSVLLENEAYAGFFGRYRALKLFAHVVRIRAAERHGDADEGRRFAGTF